MALGHVLVLGGLLLAAISTGITQSGSETVWTENAPNGYTSVDNKLEVAGEFKSVINGLTLQISCVKACRCKKDCTAINYDKETKTCELLSKNHLDATGGGVAGDQKPEFKVSTGYNYRLITDYVINETSLYQCAKTSTPGSVEHGACSAGLNTCVCNAGFEGETCSTNVVEPTLTEWSTWGSCSRSCASGSQRRTRSCVNSANGENKPLPATSTVRCVGHLEETRACMNLPPCPVWAAWTDFEQCSSARTCGRGFHSRARTCENSGTVGVDRHCMGSTKETKKCSSTPCDQPITLASGEFGNGHIKMLDGYICGDSLFNQKAGEVACRQLGFAGCKSVEVKAAPTTAGTPKYVLSNVQCAGNELTLQSCQHTELPKDGASTECTSAMTGYVSCIVNGHWSFWTGWSSCSVTCKNGNVGGIHTRSRDCSRPPSTNGGAPCFGEPQQEKQCEGLPNCPIDGYWAAWQQWSSCTHTCGPEGTRKRTRECNEGLHGGVHCVEGKPEATEECHRDVPCPVDGYWKEWTEWTSCTKVCGGGSSQRSRVCVEPLHNGKACEGPKEETKDCNSHACPVDGVWQPWSEWDECTLTCGGGTQKRVRVCTTPAFGGKACNGTAEESRECATQACPVHGAWSSWTDWTTCTKTCNTGTRSRGRVCDNPAPKFGGRNCSGDANSEENCNTQPCPVDGGWSLWSDWTSCTVSCGGGKRNRKRACDSPAPLHNGTPCEGETDEIADCNGDVNCPVDGFWRDWSEWTLCTVTCGGGTQTRNRVCVEPKFNGKACEGDAEETKKCNEEVPCPIDGVWGEWTEWSVCTVSCGGGTQERSRVCADPQHNGKPCEGDAQATRSCNEEVHCPVDGQWKPWTAWSACPVTCGGGDQSRSRECVPPLHNGKPCEGNSNATQRCNTGLCPVPGSWIQWAPWSACSSTCKGGMRLRERQCNMTSYDDLTILPCVGNNTMEQSCNDYACTPVLNCAHLKKRGVSEDTWATIDPDGPACPDGFDPKSDPEHACVVNKKMDPMTGGKEPDQLPFTVWCDMTIENGVGTAIVKHDNMGLKTLKSGPAYESGTEDDDNAIKKITYANATIPQLRALMSSCASASMYVNYTCKGAGFHFEKNPATLVTYWRNRDSIQTDYWGGARDNIAECKCSADKAASGCDGSELDALGRCPCGYNEDEDTGTKFPVFCNCDVTAVVGWTFDDGFLTRKDDLPMLSMKFGDLGILGVEEAKIFLGELSCSGLDPNLKVTE